jgi:hypothetical protein
VWDAAKGTCRSYHQFPGPRLPPRLSRTPHAHCQPEPLTPHRSPRSITRQVDERVFKNVQLFRRETDTGRGALMMQPSSGVVLFSC